MKKIVSILMTMLLSTSLTACAAEAPSGTVMSQDGLFEYEPFERAPDNGRITAYYGDKVVDIPAEIDGVQVYEVGEKAFFDLDILSVYINEGVVVIGTSAFEGCNVADVTIPNSVDYINDSAFANCSELVTVTLNSADIEFGKDVFANTTYMQFMIPCTIDPETLREKLIATKGADNFNFVTMHEHLEESAEKDFYGEPVMYCADCGYSGSSFAEESDNAFEDVSPDSWYYTYVQMANDSGIMVGKSDTLFKPDDGMTLAEAATIAARIRESQYHEHTIFEPEGEHWYDVYVNYCYRNGIIEEGISFDWDMKATRAEMAYLFSHCDLTDYYINEVPMTDIPDVNENTFYYNEILDLYNKGVAVGSDESMTYYPDANVKRCEVAAIVARIMNTHMRIELPKG